MRITEVERPGLVTKAFYKVGERMFGMVPTPERAMAHRGSTVAPTEWTSVTPLA